MFKKTKGKKQHNNRNKESYKYYALGFVAIGVLSSKIFLDIANYDEDVQKIALTAMTQSQQENETNTPNKTTGNDKNKADSDIPTSDNNNASPTTDNKTPNGEDSDVIVVEKEDIILKPTDAAHYIPKLVKYHDKIELENEELTITTNVNMDTFFTNALSVLGQTKIVKVTELESNEYQEKNSTEKILRQYTFDYENLYLNKIVKEKIGDGKIKHTEETYVSKDGIYLIYPNNLDSDGNLKFSTISFGDNKMNKNNLLEKTALFDIKRSPYSLVEKFSSPSFRNEYTVAENDNFYVFYQEEKEEFHNSTKYNIEVFWFDKSKMRPVRSFEYETMIKEDKHEYALKEFVYDNWNNENLSIEFPDNFETEVQR